MGLDYSLFGTVRSHILNMDPLPTINKAYALITRKERHWSIGREQDERADVAALTDHGNYTHKDTNFSNSYDKRPPLPEMLSL